MIILFGGKGAGKSTFLRRLLYHKTARKIESTSLPVVIDFLACPQDEVKIREFAWREMVRALDIDDVLSGDITVLESLFDQEFGVAKNQLLAGIPETTLDYIRLRNQFLHDKTLDLECCARALTRYWAKRSRIPVLVFDNTDQLPGVIQDACFLTAHEASREISCMVIISMREERYRRAKASGSLDAYHNNGYHLPSPASHEVFIRRIDYVIDALQVPETARQKLGLPDTMPVDNLRNFFMACKNDFRLPGGNLRTFLDKCSQGNLRLALDFFRQFMTSGYTNVDEMTKDPNWTLAPHQVLKPMIVPNRYNYDESKNAIPNIFQLRATNPHAASHFTAIRILRYMESNSGQIGAGPFFDVDAVLSYFEDKFGMRVDCQNAIDLMLRNRMLEASNRLEAYSERYKDGESPEYIYCDSIRATSYGSYLCQDLASDFTYLDLVSLDCSIRDHNVCERLCALARDERALGRAGNRKDRLAVRLDKVACFLDYLKEQEDAEYEHYSLDERVMESIITRFRTNEQLVLRSAGRSFQKVGRVAVEEAVSEADN